MHLQLSILAATVMLLACTSNCLGQALIWHNPLFNQGGANCVLFVDGDSSALHLECNAKQSEAPAQNGENAVNFSELVAILDALSTFAKHFMGALCLCVFA